MNVTGRDGLSIKDHRKDGATSLICHNTHRFPNMFATTGPMIPSALFNIPLGIERDGEWITDLIGHMDQHSYVRFEADAEAEKRLVAHTVRRRFSAAPIALLHGSAF